MALPMLRHLVVCGALIACVPAPPVWAGSPFDHVQDLDAKLVRGQSTKKDVRRLFGRPDQEGDARLPQNAFLEEQSGALREVWYYEEQKIHHSRWNPKIQDGKLQADVELRTLYVFFNDDRFDGYIWFGMRAEKDELP